MNISAIIKLTVSMALFGSIGFFTVHTGVPATELVFVRCICATLFLGVLWLITGGHKTEERNYSNDYLWRFPSAKLGIFI